MMIPDAERNRSLYWLGRYGVAAAILVAGVASVATGQVTVTDLIGPDVSPSEIGSRYDDVKSAITFFSNGDIDAARSSLKTAIKNNPQLPPPDVLLARLCLKANQVTTARSLFEKTIVDVPDDPEAYVALGEFAYREGHMTNAELLFAKGRSLCESYKKNQKRQRNLRIRAFAGLAAVAETRRQWDAAEKLLKAWLKIDPENTLAQTRLGRTQFHQAVALGTPKSPGAKEKYSESYATFRKLYEQDDSAPRPEINMALLFEQADMRPNAKQLMERVFSRAGKDDLNTRLAVAQWALEAGELDMAKKSATEAMKLKGNPLQSFQAKMIGGMVARYSKDYAAAEKLFISAHLQSPSNFATINHLALSLAEQSDAEKRRLALEYADLNARAHSDLGQSAGRQAAMTRAWILYTQGRENEAVRTVQATLRSGGLGGESAYYAARILEAKGGANAAVQLLQPLLKSDRGFIHREDAKKLLDRIRKTENGKAKKP